MGCIKSTGGGDTTEALRRCPLYNQHSHIQSFYRVGVSGEKTPEGEVHIGLKAAKTKKIDREYSRVNGKKKDHPLEEVVENRVPSGIPSIEEVMRPQNQLIDSTLQEGVT